MEKEFFDLLGLGIPFYLGAATYAVFAWLDSNASDEATKVISSWLHGRSHNRPDLGNLIISAFDRIYTSPLLSFRAFGRSAAISTIAWLSIYFIPLYMGMYDNPSMPSLGVQTIINLSFEVIMTFLVIIISDYISLFFVRKLLILALTHPLKATLGAFLVMALIAVMIVGLLCIPIIIADKEVSISSVSIVGFTFFGKYFLGILSPALLVHLWLPLFILASFVVRLIYLLFRAVEWAQWFLKQGDAHPFKTIGVIATIIVFVSAMIVKEGWALLSVLERS
jgi:hypothetical protein